MVTESKGTMKPVAVIIVGADVLQAAQPATPIQLWHACLAAGYDLAVPATWGDELIAAECLRAAASHPADVAVMCSCPLVARTLGEMRGDIADHLVSIVAPPVATAKYLRRVYGERRVHITYVGACPAAADSAIDAWVAPAELLERFRATEIVLTAQPELFESILPPDRRRNLSVPGGLPVAAAAASAARPRRVHEIHDADLPAALERHLASGVRSLLDIAPRAGCACSGAAADVPAAGARAAVMALEPPRSARPVIVDPAGLGLSRRLPVRTPVPVLHASPALPAGRASTGVHADPPQRAPVAARAASRSPLSWHLRERAHPQPPTTEHPDARRSSAGGRPSGASSARWAAAAEQVAPGGEEAPDAITAAAVHALEQAARRPASPARHAADDPANEVRRQGEALTARPTPPGGYWFAAPIAPNAPDAEVDRRSEPVAAVPDDVVRARDFAVERGTEPVGASAAEPAVEPEVESAVEPAAEPALATPAELVAQSSAEPPATSAAPDADAAAELAEMFRRNEAIAEAPSSPPPIVAPDTNAPSSAAAAPHAQPQPPRNAAVHAGPLPWKWLIGALLLMASAIFVARGINQRVTNEDAGTSALVGGPGSLAPAAPPPPAESVAAAPPGRAAETRPSATARATARRAPPVAQAPALVEARPETLTVIPVTPGMDSVRAAQVQLVAPPVTGAPPLTARELELQSIRDEIARRAARLDSMSRAIDSLYTSPRTPPSGPVRPPPARPVTPPPLHA